MNINIKDRLPGMYERYLLRKQNNWLFPADEQLTTGEQLIDAQMRDQQALEKFQQHFQSLVQRAVTLEANTASETVLELKEALDRSYQITATLPGDQTAVRQAIEKLIEAIMRSVWREVGEDAYAQQQLRDEESARKTHFRLQLNALVADLTAEESPVSEAELVPCLLSEKPESLRQVLGIFDEQQLVILCQQADALLDRLDPDRKRTAARVNLAIIHSTIEPGQTGNASCQ